MIAQKIILIALFVMCASGRHVRPPKTYIVDSNNILNDDFEDFLIESGGHSHPLRVRHAEPGKNEMEIELRGIEKTFNEDSEDSASLPAHVRITRQLHGSANTNPDGTMNLNAKLPILGNDKNMLSAVGSANGLKPGGAFGAAGAGLAYDHVNGHGASVTGTNIPNFGNQLTAAGKLNLLHTPDHNVNANAFTTRTMPNIPNVPNFNTVGGGLDYSFRDKVGASVGMSHTPLFQKTDYSAMGNLNLFRDKSSSLDMNAGFSKSVSPFIPRSGWEPSGRVIYTKYW